MTGRVYGDSVTGNDDRHRAASGRDARRTQSSLRGWFECMVRWMSCAEAIAVMVRQALTKKQRAHIRLCATSLVSRLPSLWTARTTATSIEVEEFRLREARCTLFRSRACYTDDFETMGND